MRRAATKLHSGFGVVDYEAERVVRHTKFLGLRHPGRFEKKADRVFVVPTLGLVGGVGDVVAIVCDLGAEIQILAVPRDVVARGQIIFRRGLVAVIGETVDLRVIPGRMGEASDVPEAVVECIVLPVG